MATDLPKGKKKIVNDPGATRRRTLSVIFAVMSSDLTKAEVVKRTKLSERTVERIFDDAAKVGFKKYMSRDGKILLTYKKG